jgi:hypothetical protein
MLARAAAPNERGSVKYNNCAKSDINKSSRRNTVFQKKKEFLLRVVAKNGSGKNSILQPGVSGLRVGFGLG